MTDIDIKIQWHSPDSMWAAVFMRDGEPWYLDGVLVGMGSTPDAAVEDLLHIADHLILFGENFLSNGQISHDARRWLFSLMDRGNDHGAVERRHAAMREAGLAGTT